MSSTLKTQIEVSGSKEVKDRLRDLSRALGGKSDLMQPVWEDVGIAGSGIFTHIFEEQGSRFDGGWMDLSPITKILRPRGGRAKYTTIEEAESDTSHKILQDSGIGRQSFLPGSTANVLEVGKNSVTIGSRMKRMKLHNAGGSTTFKFGQKERSRFESGFSKTLPGSKPKTTPTGRKSRAKKHWNAEYFKLYNGLKNLDGKSCKIHERRIQPTADEVRSDEYERIYTVLLNGIDHVMKQVFDQVTS